MRHAALALALALAVNAGCLGGSEPFVSARELLEGAERIARAEAGGDVELTFAFTYETDNVSGAHEAGVPEWLRPFAREADPAPGDGSAQAWAFGFVPSSGAGEAVVVILGADGERQSMEGIDDINDVPSTTPLGQWSVDSKAAADIARTNNAAYDRASQSVDLFASTVLMADEAGVPAWHLLIESDGGAEAFATVNARNGSYSDGMGAVKIATAATEQGSFAGTATATSSSAHPVQLHESHDRITFTLDADGTVPVNRLVISIEGPAGVAGGWTWTPGPQGNDQRNYLLEPAPAGEWTVSVDLDQGVQQAYTIEWCAGGSGPCIPSSPNVAQPARFA